MKTITVIVRPNGESSLETNGFTGSSCKDASRFLEQAIGMPQSERLTPEFHRTVTTDQIQQQH